MSVAIYPGSFDPITYGHISILQSALNLADNLIIAIGVHGSKKPVFTFEERKEMILEIVKANFSKYNKKIQIVSFDNLLVEKAEELRADFIVRGLRNFGDFDYEMQLAAMNKKMAPNLQTVFLPAEDAYRSISSSLVKQIAYMKGDVSAFVPKNIVNALVKKVSKA